MILEWGRAKRDKLATADRRTWVSKCGYLQIQELTNRVGGMPDSYLALHRQLVGDVAIMTVVTQHRTRNAAVKACESHFKKVEANDKRSSNVTRPGQAANRREHARGITPAIAPGKKRLPAKRDP